MIILHRPKFIVLSDCGGSSLDDLYLIELFISIILLRTLKGGWCFSLTSSELHFLPEFTILDICHFVLHGKEAGVPTLLPVNWSFFLCPPFCLGQSMMQIMKTLSNFQPECIHNNMKNKTSQPVYIVPWTLSG